MPHDRTTSVVETHVSTVFFTAERAYKLLKPVDLGFLDFSDTATGWTPPPPSWSSTAASRPTCTSALADVVEHGELVDRMIVMRRLPDDRRLSALDGSAELDGCLRAVARRMAVFHAAEAAPPDGPPSPGVTRCAGTGTTTWPWCGTPRATTSGRRWSGSSSSPTRSSTTASALFQQRMRDGMVRDGHGDLLADDIFCLDDGPRILDCLAFDEALRVGDVLLDISFLAMDVERLAGPGAAETLLRAYQELSDEHHPGHLAHHYIAYRAAGAGEGGAAALRAGRRCRRRTCRRPRRAVPAPPRGRTGPPRPRGRRRRGREVDARHWTWRGRCAGRRVSTDEIRREAPVWRRASTFAPPGEGLYEPARVDAVYGTMIDRARMLLERGEAVILDASWTAASHRRQARDLATSTGSELVEIECRLPPAIAKERIARRLASLDVPSDATPAVVDHQAAVRDPWPEAEAADMARPPDEIAAAMCRMVRGR